MTKLSISRSGIRRRRGDTGASAVEYALIIAGVAVASITVVAALQRVGTSALGANSNQMNLPPNIPSSSTSAGPVPVVPAAPIASGSDGSVTLSWVDVPGATSYLIYGCGGTVITVTSTSYTCGGLTNGTTYSFSIAAANSSGASANSTTVSATPMPPAPATPTLSSATPGNGTIALVWTSATGATGYKVFGCGASVITLASTATSYTCTGLTNGNPYTVSVSATGPGGESTQSNTLTATPRPPGPTAPTNLIATPGNGTIALNWDDMPNATSYTVTGCGTPITVSVSNYTCTGLTGGQSYTISVTANGPGGTSPATTVTAKAALPVPRNGTLDNSQRIGTTGAGNVTGCVVAPVSVPGVTVTCSNGTGGGRGRVNFTATAAAPSGTLVTVTVTYFQGGVAGTATYPYWVV